ncbi:MAG: NAD-dependent epimerase/dehydratase family protein [Desulfopila sp.]|jgi:nucleoside-diphosphate-sugar epimerase|nr:NAD-dependent epimerase/dehydratase family protein [Desulfopila sp.]
METQKSAKKLGVVIGGSGLIGGTLVHYFKTQTPKTIEIRAPSSKKISIRSANDIRSYFEEVHPDFLINAAITNLSSNSRLALEVNYLGAIHLARAAAEHNIPYIHFTTAAALPYGNDLREHDTLPVTANLNNYAKSKLMAEKSLQYLHDTIGLDYTSIRLAIVYGDHDHKIQGFHRLFFSIVEQSMPFLFTARGIQHSYSNCRKVPYFVHHILENREEFSGKTYNFVDKDPVELAKLILTIKKYLQLKSPKEVYVPYNFAKNGKWLLSLLLRLFAKFGLVARMPQELMFLESFYQNQTLSSAEIRQSSFVDPDPHQTIFSLLPDIASYYLTRWSEQNLITARDLEPSQKETYDKSFRQDPSELIDLVHASLTEKKHLF